jgi:hypothetical protein
MPYSYWSREDRDRGEERMTKFVIYVVQNGFLLNITTGKVAKSYVFSPTERMKMLAHIDMMLGDEPEEVKPVEEQQSD